MEKYKSDLIREEHLIVNVDKREIGDEIIRIVTIKHILSGFVVSVEDKSQLKAYNEAIKLLEIKYQGGEYICYNNLTECTSCNEKLLCREELINYGGTQKVTYFCKECDKEIDEILEYYNQK